MPFAHGTAATAAVCPPACPPLQVIKLPCPPPLAITEEEAQGVEVGARGELVVYGTLPVWYPCGTRVVPVWYP